MTIRRGSNPLFGQSLTLPTKSSQTTITGNVPAGSTATATKNGTVAGSATVSALGVATYTFSSPLVIGDIVGFTWSLTGSTTISVIGSTASTSMRANPKFVGVNMPGLANGNRGGNSSDIIGQQYTTYTPADFRYLAARSVTVVRLPVMVERLFNSLGAALNTTYASQIAAVLGYAASSNIAVMIDLHGFAEYHTSTTVYGFGQTNQYSVSEFSRQWQAVSTYFKGMTGLWGYSYNEPQNIGTIGPSGTVTAQQLLPIYMNAMADAIQNPSKGNDQTAWICISGDNYTNAENFSSLNPNYPLTDTYDRFIYEGHMYADPGSGGNQTTYPTWASCVSAGSTATTGATRIGKFNTWCTSKGVRGFIGETGLYADSSAALDADYNTLYAATSVGLSIAAWMFDVGYGTNANNLYPINGFTAPDPAQWGPMQQAGTASKTYTLSGPAVGTVNQASGSITVAYVGKSSTPIVVTGKSSGSGSFSGVVTLPANTWNPTTSITFTDTVAETVNLSTTNNASLTNPRFIDFNTTGSIPGGNDNLILTQNIYNPLWNKNGDATLSDYVDPADGLTYTNVVFNSGDYHTSISYAPSPATTVAGWMQCQIKPLVSGLYLGQNGGGGDNNFNNPTVGTWIDYQTVSNAGNGFFMFNRNSAGQSFLVRHMKINSGSNLSAWGSTAVATTTTLTLNPTSATTAQSVTMTANVTATTGTPTGTVTFYNGSTNLGSGTLSNGVATFPTTLSNTGTNSITAGYAGVSGFAASVSSAQSIVVTAVAGSTPVKYIPTSSYSSYNSGLSQNSTYATDPSGGHTAARFTDNSANTDHTAYDNTDSISIVSGSTYGVKYTLLKDSIAAVTVKVFTSNSGTSVNLLVNVDLTNLVSSITTSTGVSNTVVTFKSNNNGFVDVLVKFQATVSAAICQQIGSQAPYGTVTYVGNGADFYIANDGVNQPQMIGPY